MLDPRDCLAADQIVRCGTDVYNQGMSTIAASEARATMPQLLDSVARGEEVTITRHGRPVAVLVHPDVLRRRRADRVLSSSAELQRRLNEARGDVVVSSGGISVERADELVADVRVGRSAR